LLIYNLNVKQFGSQMKLHILWGFIWIQIVCIGHQRSSKFTASGLRVIEKFYCISSDIIIILNLTLMCKELIKMFVQSIKAPKENVKSDLQFTNAISEGLVTLWRTDLSPSYCICKINIVTNKTLPYPIILLFARV